MKDDTALSFEEFEDVKAYVESQGNIATIPMKIIKPILKDCQSLGHVQRKNISDGLKGVGLDHRPTEVPTLHEVLRVFKQGTKVFDLIQAAEGKGEKDDNALKQIVNASPNASEKIEEAKETSAAGLEDLKEKFIEALNIVANSAEKHLSQIHDSCS